MARSYKDVLAERRAKRYASHRPIGNDDMLKELFRTKPIDSDFAEAERTVLGVARPQYMLAWRHNANCPWYIVQNVYTNIADVREARDSHAKYDMARREYAIVPVAPENTWEII